MEEKDLDITSISNVEEKTEVSAENTENNETKKKKAEFWVIFKKYLNVGLCVIAVLFSIIGKILLASFASGAKEPVYIAGVWMSIIALGFAIACSVMQCLQFIKNKKFEFSTQIYINLLTYIIIMI